MDQLDMKTEVQSNENIVLYYVNENQNNLVIEQVKTENIPQDQVQEEDTNFIITNVEGFVDHSTFQNLQTDVDNDINQEWKQEDIEKLLVFYIDNKDSFLKNDALKKHFWTIACKTSLTDKNASLCETKLESLKENYTEICKLKQKGRVGIWPFYELCYQAFHDESFEEMLNNESEEQKKNLQLNSGKDSIKVTRKKLDGRSSIDRKVEQMLNLYLKYKDAYKISKSFCIWDAIALEMGEEDADYVHRRFLNFKQHYITLLYKRHECGPEKIHWPYMTLYDKIFKDDEDFNRKYCRFEEPCDNIKNVEEASFNDAEMTVLVKYYFDCFHEFQDPTIPQKFLWHEIGRLLDKTAEQCKEKYNEMKIKHVNTLMNGNYDMANRIPMAIILDNIIARETELELTKLQNVFVQYEALSKKEIDELVQFFYDNVECFKDRVCYYVCWHIIAKKLNKNIHNCKKQWQDLTNLYRSILEEKKENPDMQIDWNYINLFDIIFDYGMDADLLEGYENVNIRAMKVVSHKVGGGVNEANGKDDIFKDYSENEESYDERGLLKQYRTNFENSRGFKILDYYLKNKDKFVTCPLKKKLFLWEIIAKQLGLSREECSNILRNFKQIYIKYVKKEINKPDIPIFWPYYALCKRVFGYRDIKSKLKNNKEDTDDGEEWVTKEIKQLINYYSNNYEDLCNNVEDTSRWSDLSRVIRKTPKECSEKFQELRQSYRKLKILKATHPEVKVPWRHFNMLDKLFTGRESEHLNNSMEEMEIDDISDRMDVDHIKMESTEDDDFQYIIVVPEESSENIDIREIIQDSEDTQHVAEDTSETIPQEKSKVKWNRRSKKLLLLHYLKYLRSHKGEEIDSREMWKEISLKLKRSPLLCKRIFIELKKQHKRSSTDEDFKTKSPYYKVIEKILQLKPKFVGIGQERSLQENKTYKDIDMSDEKVEQALLYYLDNLEEFCSPKFEKKYVWLELANFVKEPVSKVFNKIQYLKKSFNAETSEMPFGSIIQEILAKEVLLKDQLRDRKLIANEVSSEDVWRDDEIEQLLTWYLTNLDKFKNPKYVRCYLWENAAEILRKIPLLCSKKMSEIRTQYRNMVREAPEQLNQWSFFDLCQKIYGTGKKPLNV